MVAVLDSPNVKLYVSAEDGHGIDNDESTTLIERCLIEISGGK
jgi:hypothetical protein